jgi:GNAT superfamily N-acetyltransferase
LLELRNDPAVRAVSFSSDVVEREGHLKWLREKVTSLDHLILIGEIDGDPIGQVRIDRCSPEDAQINIALIANFRGQGYGREMLQKAAAIAFSHYAELKRLRAAIVTHRSQKADDRCIEDDDRLYRALGDGIGCDRRVGDKDAMLDNCARFILQRCEGGGWPSYVELEAAISALLPYCAGADVSGLGTQSRAEWEASRRLAVATAKKALGRRQTMTNDQAIREARAAALEEAAKLVEALWTPSVGGYPGGSELASAIRKLKENES